MPRFSRILIAAALVMPVACVPASEEAAPKGAFTIVTQPSPATRGEPFVTSDGWTIRVETLVLLSWFDSFPSDKVGIQGEGGEWLFRATTPIEAVVRAIPIGPTTAMLRLGFGGGSETFTNNRTTLLGADAATEARFKAPADGEPPSEGDCTTSPNDCSFSLGPSFWVKATATRDGRRIALDLALLAHGFKDELRIPTEVRANTTTPVPVAVLAEQFFTNPAGALVFDDIAAADRDNDGRVSVEELLTTDALYVPSPDPSLFPDDDPPSPPSADTPPSVLEVLSGRQGFFQAAP